MSTPTILKDADGAFRVVNEGESMNIITTLQDLADPAATVTTVTTITLTLYDKVTRSIINSRQDQNINNANNSTFSSGVLTIELDADDSVISDTGRVSEGDTEDHIAKVTYTWSDGNSTRTAIEEFLFKVRRSLV
jgi:hypothetical protein